MATAWAEEQHGHKDVAKALSSLQAAERAVQQAEGEEAASKQGRKRKPGGDEEPDPLKLRLKRARGVRTEKRKVLLSRFASYVWEESSEKHASLLLKGRRSWKEQPARPGEGADLGAVELRVPSQWLAAALAKRRLPRESLHHSTLSHCALGQ